MTSLTASLILLLTAGTASAAEVLREISWTTDGGPIPGATVVPPGGDTPFVALKVENRREERVTITVLTFARPPITSARYAISGSIRYEAVHGTGFLEMWSEFPGGERYFSRTLAETGLLKRVAGSSGWRPFALPFFNREGGLPPAKLTVNVALPGIGTVYVGPLRLLQYAAGEDPLAAPGQWWGERTGGLVGGLFGGALGCLGAMLGSLSSRGRARRLVLGSMKIVAGLGAAAAVSGAVAWSQGQPYAVYYPLVLVGSLGAVICGTLLHSTRKRYEEMELRRIRAADVR